MELFRMSVPAIEEFATLASNSIRACCAIYKMDLSILNDVGIASLEALCCLRSQKGKVDSIMIECQNEDRGIVIEFTALSYQVRENNIEQDDDITRGILEVLVPKVNILSDDRGIFCITFFFPRSN